jgi:hypothetical protein
MNYEYKWGYKLVNEKYLRYKNHWHSMVRWYKRCFAR